MHDVAKQRVSELFVIMNASSKLSGVLSAIMIRHVALLYGWGMVTNIVGLHYIVSGLFLVALMPQASNSSKLFAQDPIS